MLFKLFKIVPYLLAPAGLYMLWLVVYINHIVAAQPSDWWHFPLFCTLFIIEIASAVISIFAIRKIKKRSGK